MKKITKFQGYSSDSESEDELKEAFGDDNSMDIDETNHARHTVSTLSKEQTINADAMDVEIRGITSTISSVSIGSDIESNRASTGGSRTDSRTMFQSYTPTITRKSRFQPHDQIPALPETTSKKRGPSSDVTTLPDSSSVSKVTKLENSANPKGSSNNL